MGYKLLKYKNQFDSDYREYQVDTRENILTLPTTTTSPDRAAIGSMALVEVDSSVWVLASDNTWKELDPVTISIINDLAINDPTKPASSALTFALKNLVDGKVAKTDIINDLTTGGATKIASAETVKLLNETKLDINATSDSIEEGVVNKYFNTNRTASELKIADTAGNFSAGNVEDALAETGELIQTLTEENEEWVIA